jgi:hypothetical protein
MFRAGGVTQMVECLTSKGEPWVQTKKIKPENKTKQNKTAFNGSFIHVANSSSYKRILDYMII